MPSNALLKLELSSSPITTGDAIAGTVSIDFVELQKTAVEHIYVYLDSTVETWVAPLRQFKPICTWHHNSAISQANQAAANKYSVRRAICNGQDSQ